MSKVGGSAFVKWGVIYILLLYTFILNTSGIGYYVLHNNLQFGAGGLRPPYQKVGPPYPQGSLPPTFVNYCMHPDHSCGTKSS